MTGFTDRTSQGILNHIVGKTALYTLPTCYVGLFLTVGTDAGTGFTEPTVGAYARVATAAGDWAAASGSAPSQISNANTLTFPTATADWGSIVGSTGNLLAWDFFGAYNWSPATVNAASPAVITTKAHGYSVADLVEWSIEYGGTNPTFSASNFTGVLAVATASTDTFSVTNATVAVNTSASGNGMVRKILPQSITNGSSAAFPAGSLIIRSS
jgi:hypothetical protein